MAKCKKPTKKELEEKVKELEDKYLRVLADFDNYRKRMIKELQEAREYGKLELLQDFLPIIDNIEMSLKMKDSDPRMIVKGIEMIHRNIIETLRSHGIDVYESNEGDEFDPELHEPILVDDKEAESGKVLSVVSKGYRFKGRVIRPSKVKVKKEE